MKVSNLHLSRIRPASRAAAALLLACWISAPLYGQEPAPSEAPASQPPAAQSETPPESGAAVDLHTLMMEARSDAAQRPGNAGKAALSLSVRRDGTVEVRDASGALIELYPPGHFSLSGHVSTSAVERIQSRREALEAQAEERRALEQEALEREQEVAREAAEREKQQAAEREAKWKSEFEANSNSYLNRRTGENLKAVKIDAREIRDDGTYTYEGRDMKPVRLWNNQRKRYEMAIPVEEP